MLIDIIKRYSILHKEDLECHILTVVGFSLIDD